MKQIHVVRRTERDLSPRTLLRIAGIVLGTAFLVAFVTIVLTGAGVRRGWGCSACHSMQPYVDASLESAHASIGCEECHATPGVTGFMADGARAVGWFSSALVGTDVSGTSSDTEPCLACHTEVLDGIVEADGIAVQHIDFVDTPCSFCHGGTAHVVENREYKGPEMDDCVACHTTAATNLSGCDICHVEPDGDEKPSVTSAWQVTHGSNWRSTHGMGDLDGCPSCHTVASCAKCHGVRVPHPADWIKSHGVDLDDGTREACATCHEPSWCSDCHGVEMPHPAGFLPVHGQLSDEVGSETCSSCHDQGACDFCHYKSSHPNVPGVTSGHAGG